MTKELEHVLVCLTCLTTKSFKKSQSFFNFFLENKIWNLFYLFIYLFIVIKMKADLKKTDYYPQNFQITQNYLKFSR